MSNEQFHKTVVGRRFFESQVPRIIANLERIDKCIERLPQLIADALCDALRKEYPTGPDGPGENDDGDDGED